MSISTMLKKAITITAVGALTFAGLTVMPSIAGATGTAPKFDKTSWSLESSGYGQNATTSTGTTVNQVADQYESLILFSFGNQFARSIAGHEIVIDWNATIPAGSTFGNGMAAGEIQKNIYIDGNGFWAPQQETNVIINNDTAGEPEGSSVFTIPASITDYTQDYQYLRVQVSLFDRTAIAAGQYEIAPTFYDRTADAPIALSSTTGTAFVAAETSMTRVSGAGSYSGTIPAGATLGQNITTCVVSNALVAEHSLFVDRTVGGTILPQRGYGLEFRQKGAYYSAGTFTPTWTVPADIADRGWKGIRIDDSISVDNTSGTTPMVIPAMELAVKDGTAGDAEINSSCAAATPAKPTFTLNNRQSGRITWTKNSDDTSVNMWNRTMDYSYSLFKRSDMTTPVQSGNLDMLSRQDDTYSQNLEFRDANWQTVNLDLDTEYVVVIKARDQYDQIDSAFSEPSDPAMISSPATPAAPTLEILDRSSAKITWNKIPSDVAPTCEYQWQCSSRTVTYSYEMYKVAAPSVVIASGELNAPYENDQYTLTMQSIPEQGQPFYRTLSFDQDVEYGVRIKAYDVAMDMYSSWSPGSPADALTGPPTPAAPALEIVDRSSIKVTWDKTQGDTLVNCWQNQNGCSSYLYYYELYKTSEPNTLVSSGELSTDTVSGNTYTATVTDLRRDYNNVRLNANVGYFVKIKALTRASSLTSLWSEASAEAILAGPAAPAAPTLEMLDRYSFKVTWDKISTDVVRTCGGSPCGRSVSYYYELYKASDPTVVVADGSLFTDNPTGNTYTANEGHLSLNVPPYELITFAANEPYFIRIMAHDNDGDLDSLWSANSASASLTGPPAPAAPTVTLLTPSSMRIVWTKVSGDTGPTCEYCFSNFVYSYEIYKTTAPTVIVYSGSLSYPTLSGSTYTKEVTGMTGFGMYGPTPVLEGSNTGYIVKIKVRNNNSELESVWSEPSASVALPVPPTPQKPTITRVTVTDIQASFTARANERSTDGFSYSAKAYDEAFPDVVLGSGSCSAAPNTPTSYTCYIMSAQNMPVFTAPKFFVVKIFATKNQIASLGSPASDHMIGGIPGVTAAAPSGGTAPGDAKFLTESFPRIIETFGSAGTIIADARGSYYSIARATPANNTSPVTYEVQKIKSDFTGVESSFGPSGKRTMTVPVVVVNGNTNQARSITSSFFANSSKLALFSSASNCMSVPGQPTMCPSGSPSTRTFFSEATLGEAIAAPEDITDGLFDFCLANVDGTLFDGMNDAYVAGFEGSSAFSRPVVRLTCSGYDEDGQYGPRTYYDQNFLVTLAQDGTPTILATLNETNSTENRMDRVVASVNPNASGDDVAAFVVVVTAKGANGSSTTPYTNYARKILRITADGTVTSTPSAYQVPAGTEPSFNLAAVNDGTTVYGLMQSGSPASNKLYSANIESGVFDSGSVVTAEDQTPLSLPTLSFPKNAVPNVDVQDSPDQGQKISFVKSLITPQSSSVAPMSYRLSDGSTVSGEAISYSRTGSPVFYTEVAANGNMYFLFTPAVSGSPNLKVIRWIETRNMVAIPTPAVTQPTMAVSLNAGGATITITGVNFAETTLAKKVTKVRFLGGLSGGIEVVPTSKTATSITVKVPTSAQTGITTAPTAQAVMSADIQLVLGGGATVDAGEVVYIGTTKLAQPLTLNISELGATTGDADRTATIQAGVISQNQILMMAAPMTPPVLSTTTAAVCSIVDGKVRFLSNGTCTVKAFRAGNAWLEDGSVTKNIAVLKSDSVTAGFGPGDLPSEVLEADEAIAPVITLASGRTDYTMVSADTAVCTITADKMIWFKRGNEDCVITIATPSATAVWTAVSYTWTIPVLPPAGGAGSPLLVRNDNVMVKLPGLGVKWDQKKNQVFFITRVKWVGPVQAKMSFVDDKGTELESDDVTHTCVSNFGILKKSVLPKNNEPFIISSGAMCTDTKGESGLKLTAAEKAAQTAAYNAFKAVVARNTAKENPESTNVQFTYRRETHRASNYEKVGDALTLKPWSAPMYAKLYYRAIDNISAALPTGVVAAVSETADGAFNSIVTLESKRTDYTMVSTDNTKCEVLSDGRIWGKVAGQSCVVTIGTGTNAIWAGKSYNWTIPLVAAVADSTNSAIIAPSNNVAVNAGPLSVTWNQATSAVAVKLSSRSAGLVRVRMQFTDLTNGVHTCVQSFGAKKLSGAIDSIKAQSSKTFCAGADLIAFKALVAAKKTASAVIPVTFSFQFEQYNPVTGVLLPGQVVNSDAKPWSSNFHVKLNYRATTN